MADLTPEQRERFCNTHDVPCPRHGRHALEPAPNDDMPNAVEYDFRCPNGWLYQASDVLDYVLGEVIDDE